MSIDYDRLGELLEQWQHGDEVRDQLEAQWDMELAAPDMARELLRLRDGVRELVESKRASAGVIRGHINAGHLPEYLGYVAATAEVMCDALTDLLEGDTE